MTCAILLVFLYVLQVSTSNWISDWMTPVQEQISEENPEKFRRSGIGGILKTYEAEYQKTLPILGSREFPLDTQRFRGQEQTGGLKLKLETTLENAKVLAEALMGQIAEMTLKEKMLKEIITLGRHGVSTITVSTIGQPPRKYMIREGVWTLCTGVMQPPVAASDSFDNIFAASARCIGNEVLTKPDPCVFNSVIKYETIPTRRRLQYVEDNYLCLKPTFNVTLEQYMSVPKRLINETCSNGLIRSLDDNMIECGLRVLSDYSYYPNKEYSGPELPLEYCVEEDGACKLLVAWHVSNSTIENFEFLKDEPSFKKYFMKSNSFE